MSGLFGRKNEFLQTVSSFVKKCLLARYVRLLNEQVNFWIMFGPEDGEFRIADELIIADAGGKKLVFVSQSSSCSCLFNLFDNSGTMSLEKAAGCGAVTAISMIGGGEFSVLNLESIFQPSGTVSLISQPSYCASLFNLGTIQVLHQRVRGGGSHPNR